MSKISRRSFFAAIAVALGFVVTTVSAVSSASSAQASEGLHFRLVRSAPEADAEVAALEEVRLWFSEGAQAGATSIRVLDAAGAEVATADIVSSDDRTEHAVSLDQVMAPGAYSVAWRSMAADGHVVRGSYGFTVRTGR